MNQDKIRASIDSIETFGLVDGPGIRVVVFFNGCKLRCKYCHNPEMWTKKAENYSPQELVDKIKRYKSYFKDNGGVTFSGGEPLLHSKFIIETAKLLKEENIHIALDTSGVGLGDYNEILPYIDLVILDIKHTKPLGYKELTNLEINESEEFIKELNKSNIPVWIRQVIVPGIMDNYEYIDSLINYLYKINNIKRVDFLPFHRLGREKYLSLGLTYPYEDKPEMDKEECNKLYKYFEKNYKKELN
ncbi:MAG: pyruvate formate lyase-activating protein [Bacilli bacterium]|nr:pyruvate formate lyase-activating protein [Bacilli bacterium]